jgi:hypothetical protein
MLEIAVGTIGLLAGVLLCAAMIAIAIRRFRQDSDVKYLLASLAGAAVALVSGAVTQFILFYNLLDPETGFFGVTAGTAVVSYFSSFLSIPVGMGWGWACSFAFKSAHATRQPSASSFVVRGLVFALVATSVLVVVSFVGRLTWYGHDSTIGFPGILVALVFPGLMMIFAAGIASNFRNTSTGAALQQAGIWFAGAVILALGLFVGAVAADSLALGATRLAETWNVLILFYPFYLIASFGIAGALLFYGGRMLARTWPRLSGPRFRRATP